MPHLAGARPFGQLHFGDQGEFDPGRYSLIVRLPGERRFGRLQPDKLAVKLLKRGVAEARADMPDIAPGVAIADRKDEGSEEGARFLGAVKPAITTSWRFEVLILSQSSVRAPDRYLLLARFAIMPSRPLRPASSKNSFRKSCGGG